MGPYHIYIYLHIYIYMFIYTDNARSTSASGCEKSKIRDWDLWRAKKAKLSDTQLELGECKEKNKPCEN